MREYCTHNIHHSLNCDVSIDNVRNVIQNHPKWKARGINNWRARCSKTVVKLCLPMCVFYLKGFCLCFYVFLSYGVKQLSVHNFERVLVNDENNYRLMYFIVIYGTDGNVLSYFRSRIVQKYGRSTVHNLTLCIILHFPK